MSKPLHVTGARIWTADGSRPRATSMTELDGRISAIDAPPPPGAEILEAAGRWVLPGFIDAHLHLLLGGLSMLHLDLAGVPDAEAFRARVAAAHAAADDGVWLLARGWAQDDWGGAMPDKSWLAAAGDRPVVCRRIDEHAVLVNDAVLERLELDDCPARLADLIVRDASGAPTGLFLESAAWELVNPIVPAAGADARRAALRGAERHALAHGITTVGSMEYADDLDQVFKALRDELRLRCRITLLDRGWPMEFETGRRFDGDDRLDVIGYKAFLDGTIGSRTARLLAPYADAPHEQGTFVELAARGDLHDWAQGVVEAGLSPSMHAIGDGAFRLAVEVVEQLGAGGRWPRPRIEHAQQVDPADLARVRGMFLSMQPSHRVMDAASGLRERVGEARLGGSYAFRSLERAGAHLAFGSDWPIVTLDPIAGIAAAVTGSYIDRAGRRATFRPEENLTVDEALLAYTRDAARGLGLDDVGHLTIGAAADFIVLDGDPWTSDWIDDVPRVVGTFAAGRACGGWDEMEAVTG